MSLRLMMNEVRKGAWLCIVVWSYWVVQCSRWVEGGKEEGRGAGSFVEEFYLQALSTLSEGGDFPPLSLEDVQWLMARMGDQPKMKKGRVFHDALVNDFLCERRQLQRLCPEEDAQEKISQLEAARQAEEDEIIRVGTKPCAPFSFCTVGKTTMWNETSDSTGYSIDFWVAIAKQLGGSQKKWSLTCVSTTPLLVDMVGNGSLDVGAACISVNSERQQRVQYSHVYFYSGLQVMVLKPDSTTGGKNALSMFDPFTLDVWLCVIAMVTIVGVCLWCFERKRNAHMKEKAWPGLAVGQWHAWTTFMQNSFINYRSWPARLTVFGFLMFSIVILATYTANLAAFLTRQYLTLEITGRQDLVGKRVATSAVGTTAYKWLRTNNGALTAVYDEDEARFQALLDGDVDAIVWDAPSLLYRAFKECRMLLVGDVFQVEDYALIMQKDYKHAPSIDLRLTELREAKKTDELYQRWFVAESHCVPKLESTHLEGSETDAVSLDTIWILFLFQLVIIFISLTMHFTPKILRHYHKKTNVNLDDSAAATNSLPHLEGIKSNADVLGRVPLCEAD